MAQLTWPSYTPRVALSLRHEEKVKARRIPLLASRLRWIIAATVLLVSTPLLGALATGGASRPPSTAPAAIAQVASQARSVLSVTDFQVTLPLQEAQVLPPPPPVAPAVNRSSGASGLFQFMPATFHGHGGTDIWDPVQQSDIAAKMFSIGESGEWVCK